MFFAVLPEYDWNNYNNITFQPDEERNDNYDISNDDYNNDTIFFNSSIYDNITNNTNQINENRRYHKPRNEYLVKMIMLLFLICFPLIMLCCYRCHKCYENCYNFFV